MKAADYRRKFRPRETDVLGAVLEYLALCPLVADAWRNNTGGMAKTYTSKRDGVEKTRYIRFSRKGISDVLGYLTDGRILAVECKREGEQPTEDQASFLDRVRAHGGVAIVARSVEDVERELGR